MNRYTFTVREDGGGWWKCTINRIVWARWGFEITAYEHHMIGPSYADALAFAVAWVCEFRLEDTDAAR